MQKEAKKKWFRLEDGETIQLKPQETDGFSTEAFEWIPCPKPCHIITRLIIGIGCIISQHHSPGLLYEFTFTQTRVKLKNEKWHRHTI